MIIDDLNDDVDDGGGGSGGGDIRSQWPLVLGAHCFGSSDTRITGSHVARGLGECPRFTCFVVLCRCLATARFPVYGFLINV